MKKYTILLLYPDYIASNYGEETYQAFAVADSVSRAVRNARKDCESMLEIDALDSLDDLGVLAVYEGHHQDVKP